MSWSTIQIRYEDYVNAIQKEDSEFDMEPNHQRESVYTKSWKSAIIQSALTSHMLIPDINFHTRDGIRESLDGNQRTTAIVEFFEDKFAFNPPKNNIYASEFPLLNKKKFSQFPKDIQDILRNKMLDLKIYSETMTNSQIAGFFITRQTTKRTSSGEKLNAYQGSKMIPYYQTIIADDEVLESLTSIKIKDKRMAYLYFVAQILYGYKHPNKSCISIANLENFWEDEKEEIDEDSLSNIVAYIVNSCKIILYCIDKNKSWKWNLTMNTLLPVFNCLNIFSPKYGIDRVVSIMNTKINEGHINPFSEKSELGIRNVPNVQTDSMKRLWFQKKKLVEVYEDIDEDEEIVLGLN